MTMRHFAFRVFSMMPMLALASSATEPPIIVVRPDLQKVFYAHFGSITLDMDASFHEYPAICLKKIMDEAEVLEEIHGYRWKRKGGYYTGGHGTFQLGTFFLKAAAKTGDPCALDASTGLGRWLSSVAEEDRGGYIWRDRLDKRRYIFDFAHGPAGIGYHLAKAYAVTGEKEFERIALGAGEWYRQTAIPEGDGCRWPAPYGSPSRTGRCNGAAGIAESLYTIHLFTGNPAMRDTADQAMQWLMSEAIEQDGGYCWYRYVPKKGSWTGKGPQAHPEWIRHQGLKGIGKGAAGIGSVFLLGHLVHHERDDIEYGDPGTVLHVLKKTPGTSKQSKYLDYAEGAARFLMATAIEEHGGYHWTEEVRYWSLKSKDGRIGNFDFCRGDLAIPLFFLALWRATGNDVYRTYAMKGGTWINASKVTDGPWAWWDPFHTGEPDAFNGVLFPSYVLLKLGREFHEPEFVATVERVLNTFLASSKMNFGNFADIPDGGSLQASIVRK